MSAASAITYDQPIVLKSAVSVQLLNFNHNKIMRSNMENL